MSKKKTYTIPDAFQVQKTEVAIEDFLEAVETPTPADVPTVYVCSESDTYASLAAHFCPEGVKKYDYAVQLAEKNKNKVLASGVVIQL